MRASGIDLADAFGSYWDKEKAILSQHWPDLNQQMFRLAVSGVSRRRMQTILECSHHRAPTRVASRHLATHEALI